MFFKVNKEKLKEEYRSIEKAQELLDKRYESKMISSEVYMSQCKINGDKKAKIRKKLGKDFYDL